MGKQCIDALFQRDLINHGHGGHFRSAGLIHRRVGRRPDASRLQAALIV
jgi:hypothetical protein